MVHLIQLSLMGAKKHLYNWLWPLVGLSVCRSVSLSGNAFVQQSTHRTLLAYLALFLVPADVDLISSLFFTLMLGGPSYSASHKPC